SLFLLLTLDYFIYFFIINKTIMKNLFLIFILIFTFYAYHFSSANSRGLEFGDIIWQFQVPDNPGTSLQDKQVRSLKQIPDVTGDGVNDVIVATGNYWTLCINGATGVIVWQYSTHFGSINTGSVEWEDAMDIADLDNNGVFDVVIGCGGGNEMVYALNGATGTVMWSYGSPTTTSDGDIEAISIKRDFNNDGFKDVIVSASGVTGGSGGRHAAICLNGLNGQQIFISTQPQPFTDDAITTDSGVAIGANNNGAPYVVNGLNNSGSIVWTFTAPGNVWSLKEIPDINGNGSKDILGLSGFNGSVYAINGTGGAIWSVTLGSSNNGKIQLLNDANANGSIDFSLSAPQVAYRIDSKTGGILWSNSLSSSYLRGIDNIGDITGDMIDDIVIATQQPARLLVLNGATGGILFEHVFGLTITQRGDRAAVLKDIDTNGVNEFLGGNREGKVILFYGGNGTVTNITPVSEIPSEYKLNQNYPNPFNPTTNINFEIPVSSFVSLKVYDVRGREISTLVNSHLNAGSHTFMFDASGLTSGVYFYTLQTNNYSKTMKMMVTK
ncbi:MAG TPA: hypothetical protein DEP28_12065, partial [Bacteroidetes bacterium]|nr:hypothetical protein [Bacteroidota bacterium]